MTNETDDKDSTQEETGTSGFSFAVKAGLMPALILEQCIQMRALLAANLDAQLEILAQLQQTKVEDLDAKYAKYLSRYRESFAGQVQHTAEFGPPDE
jgi:hypothetical protein